MRLFDGLADRSENLLPFDGVVNYLGPVAEPKFADRWFHLLYEKAAWQHDHVIIYGREIVTKRRNAWYGDDGLRYKYSGIERVALPWFAELAEIKEVVEKVVGESFNSCLLNLYDNGKQGMSWHSDDESDLVVGGTIASLSLGAERRFLFKHRQTKDKVELMLASGSLLLMKGDVQKHWLHSLPVSTKITAPRINLTFRTIEKTNR